LEEVVSVPSGDCTEAEPAPKAKFVENLVDRQEFREKDTVMAVTTSFLKRRKWLFSIAKASPVITDEAFLHDGGT
jgi:hypothetical protein